MSEKSVTRQQARPVRRQKRVVGTPRSRWGLLWWRIRCVEGRRSVRCANQRFKSEIPDNMLLGQRVLVYEDEVLNRGLNSACTDAF